MKTDVDNQLGIEKPAAPGERLPWVDALKGIGILAVVAAHVYPPPLSKALYLFHMPLFFLIGGYLLRPKTGLLSFARSKALHLLVPYACFLALVYPYQVDFILAGHPALTTHTLALLILAPIVGGKLLIGPATVFWFVTCFFVTQQLVNFLIVRFNQRQVVLFMCSSLALAYANSLLLPRFWLPWNVNVVFAAAPLFYLGYLARQRAFRTPLWASAGLAILSLVLFSSGHLVVPDMKAANYGTPVLALLFSVAWIFSLMALARGVHAVPVLGPGLKALGAASMVIMYAHQSMQLLIQRLLGIDNPTLRFVGAVVGCYLLFVLLNRWRSTRMLFLGARS
jgi:fucose 4-O-acetylase-like acetyltransferase